jgi:S1-C subfamily serine protease
MEFGEVQRGFIGVQIREVDAELAKEKGLKEPKGVYVDALTPNGAADKAGIEKGDVIKSVDGKEINSVSSLQEYVGSHRPGDEVKVMLQRDGKDKEIGVILRNKDGKIGTVVSASNTLRKNLGAEFEMATESDKNKLKIGNGVRIKSITGGTFKNSGIPPGFIITSVDKMGVYSANDVYKNLEGKKGGIMVEGYTADGSHKYYVLEM